MLLTATPAMVVAASDCPVTIGSDNELVDGWPRSNNWFGSKDLAVILSDDGTWPTTKPGHRISVKLFWFIDDLEMWRAGSFRSTIKRLDAGENDAVVSEPTTAGIPDLDTLTVLTGIHFPSEGCWQITADFEGHSLTFVVQSIIPFDRRDNATLNGVAGND
jgi:hypothetical protein